MTTIIGNRVNFWWKSTKNCLIIASSLLIDRAQIYVAVSSKLKMFIVISIHQYQYNMCSEFNVIDIWMIQAMLKRSTQSLNITGLFFVVVSSEYNSSVHIWYQNIQSYPFSLSLLVDRIFFILLSRRISGYIYWVSSSYIQWYNNRYRRI